MEEETVRDLETIFRQVEDPRVERTKRHRLRDIIILAICGVLCGADGWVEIEEFGKAKEAFFAELLDLPNGIPSHDTFGRVFALIDPKQFEVSFMQWVQGLSRTVKGVISIDGKTLRRSHDQEAGKKALHLVSAWAVENRLVLAQLATDEKSNEITAIPQLLEQLALKGCIVTIDAMGTQTKIAEQIIEQEGDYALTLKDHHGNLYDEVKATFASSRKGGLCEPALGVRATRGERPRSARNSRVLDPGSSRDPDVFRPGRQVERLARHWGRSGGTAYGAEDHQRNALLLTQFFIRQNLCHRGQKPLGH
jgi:predicted transposase YbfD/YdcC